MSQGSHKERRVEFRFEQEDLSRNRTFGDPTSTNVQELHDVRDTW